MVRSLSRPVYAGLLARVPVPISLGMRAHWHGYAGRDREQTISAKDSKEDEMLSKT